MTYEFEGKTEREAIEKATNELGIEADQFDVEILESQKNSLFKKGYVKICVHTLSDTSVNGNNEIRREGENSSAQNEKFPREVNENVTNKDFEEKMIDFTETVITKMGYSATVTVMFREKEKLGLKLDSSANSVLIGKKGSHLDALQMLVNIYATKLGRPDIYVLLDCENYRVHREESLVHLAYTMADKVHQIHRSLLLDPMNSYERRIIHTTLGDIPDIETKSEGEGAIKRVRIIPKGYRR